MISADVDGAEPPAAKRGAAMGLLCGVSSVPPVHSKMDQYN